MGNVTAYVWPLPPMIELLANAFDPWDWTLWEMPWLLVHVHVTVPPTATVSTAGLAVPLWPLLNTICPLFPTVTDPTPTPATTSATTPPYGLDELEPPQPASVASAMILIVAAPKRIRSSS